MDRLRLLRNLSFQSHQTEELLLHGRDFGKKVAEAAFSKGLKALPIMEIIDELAKGYERNIRAICDVQELFVEGEDEAIRNMKLPRAFLRCAYDEMGKFANRT